MADKLEELKKKIYSKEGPKERKQKEFYETQGRGPEGSKTYWEDKEYRPSGDRAEHHETGSFRPSLPEDLRGRSGKESPVLLTGKMTAKKPFYKSKIFIFTTVFSFSAMIAAVGLVYYGVFQKKGAVNLEITGKDAVEAGDTAAWTITVKNGLGVIVKNSELNFTYPAGAEPVNDDGAAKNLRSKIRIDEISVGEERKFTFTARLFGNTGEEKTAEVLFLYQPANVSSRLQIQASAKIVISQVPLAVSYDMPEKIVSGQGVKIGIGITSSAKSVFENLHLRMDWPIGFEFLSSDVKADYQDNIWRLKDLKPGDSRRIEVSARITGFPEEVKSLIAGIGEYNSQTKQWKIYFEKAGDIRMASPPLLVRQEVNRTQNYAARFGDSLVFTIYYKNNLPTAVRDVLVRGRLSEELLDLKNLRVEKGFFDGQSRELVWNAASAPELKELETGEEGSLAFSVVTQKRPAIGNFSDKDFVISSLAKISTMTVPDGLGGIKLDYEDLLEVKLVTELSAFAKAIFYSSPLGLNLGTLPPRVGKETGYTIVFQVSNLSNDAEGVKMYASLPGNVKWLDQITGDKKEKLSFNPSSGELVWNIGGISAGTGIVRPRLFLAFNVAITPGEDVFNNRALLVKDIRISGTDSFTKAALEGLANNITTELKEDLETTSKDWSVVE